MYKIFYTENGWDSKSFTYKEAIYEAIKQTLLRGDTAWIYNKNETEQAAVTNGGVFEYAQGTHPNLENLRFYNGYDGYYYLMDDKKLYRTKDGADLELIGSSNLPNVKYELPKRMQELWF